LNGADDLIEVGNNGGNGESTAGLCAYLDGVFLARSDRLDLGPEAAIFAVLDAVLVDLDDVFSLHEPAKQGDHVNDQKRCRKQKIDKSLLQIKNNHRAQKEKKRQHYDENRPLQICSLDAVDGDDAA